MGTMVRYIIAGAERKHYTLSDTYALRRDLLPCWAAYQSQVIFCCTARLPSFCQDGNGNASSNEDEDDLEYVCNRFAFLHVACVQLHRGPVVSPRGLGVGLSAQGERVSESLGVEQIC